MRFVSFIACGVCACTSVVSAATFKAPVYSGPRKEVASRKSSVEDDRIVSNSHRDQRPFGLNRDGHLGHIQTPWEDGSGNSPIWDWQEWAHFTEISVGTPPQTFRVLLDISDSDIFLPSSDCDKTCRAHRKYKSSLSSTYVANGTRIMGEYLRFFASGIVSQDTVQIAGIELKNLTFGEANNFWWHEPWPGNHGWDGILGLAPSIKENNGPGSVNLDTPFLSMVAKGLLDRNVFGLKLSRGLDEPGEIMFGRINEGLYEGELKSLPLLNDTNYLQRIQGRWKVPATAVSIGDGSASLEGYAATLESDFPFIALPDLFVMLLDKYLGMENKGEDEFGPKSIDCSKREELEDFTLTLGGHDFVITPYEYTIEITKKAWGGHRCISAFIGLPDFLEEKYIIVGSSFLRAFYGVFDLDERTVSLGRLKERRKSELRRK